MKNIDTWHLYAILYLLVVIDIVSTIIALETHDGIESNPIAALLLKYGYGGFITGKILPMIPIAFFVKRNEDSLNIKAGLITGIVVYLYLVISNLSVNLL